MVVTGILKLHWAARIDFVVLPLTCEATTTPKKLLHSINCNQNSSTTCCSQLRFDSGVRCKAAIERCHVSRLRCHRFIPAAPMHAVAGVLICRHGVETTKTSWLESSCSACLPNAWATSRLESALGHTRLLAPRLRYTAYANRVSKQSCIALCGESFTYLSKANRQTRGSSMSISSLMCKGSDCRESTSWPRTLIPSGANHYTMAEIVFGIIELQKATIKPPRVSASRMKISSRSMSGGPGLLGVYRSVADNSNKKCSTAR
jgi:hypothetical protein